LRAREETSKGAASQDWVHPVVDVLGVSVSAIELSDLLRDVATALEERQRLTVTFANPNYLVAASKNPSLRRMINAFDHVLTDGWGVMLAARILGKRIPVRLANDDLVVPFFDLLARNRTRVFLLGSAPGIAERAGTRLTENFPGVEIAGTMHGYLSVQEGTPGQYSAAAFDQMVQAVNDADPDLLIVGIPTPSQQRFVVENRDRLKARVIMTGGAWLDHIAERMQYYPALVVKLRLCWAYRWFREPRRLAHRYSVELADFGRRVLAQRARPARRRP
jgi:N-acetylglucosaminyldiphosphoundecaprenol N-acetyl-beta-D-mannosaminyltransferase